MFASKISKLFVSVFAAVIILVAFFGFVGSAAAQAETPDYTPVLTPWPVVVGVTETISLDPSPVVDADVHWMVNNNADGSLVLDTTGLTVTHVFTAAGDYTVGVTISDTTGVYVNAWLLTVEEPAKSRSEALADLWAAVMMPNGSERNVALATAAKDVAEAFGVNVRGAVNSTEGGSVELRPVQPIAVLSEEARAMAVDAAAGDVHYSWGAGWHNADSDLGRGTEALAGVYFDPDDDSYFGTTEPISASLWASTMYPSDVVISTANYTATFTSTLWLDSDSNGMYDLLVLGSPWNGEKASMTFYWPDEANATYTETWDIPGIGFEPKLVSAEGVSPQPAPADAFRTSVAAEAFPFVPGFGWDVEPSTGMTDTVMYGLYYGGSDLYVVCNGACTVEFSGKSYASTDANNDGRFDVSLPGVGDLAVSGPGPWDIVITNSDGTVEEHWFLQLGVTPTYIPAGGE